MLVELIVAATIVALLAAIIMSSFWERRDRELLSLSVSQAISSLEDARARAMASEGFVKHGVRVESGRLVEFAGATYASGTASNRVRALDPRMQITDINISGGPSVVFEKLTGTTTNPGTFRISIKDDPSASSTIRINASGIVEIE